MNLPGLLDSSNLKKQRRSRLGAAVEAAAHSEAPCNSKLPGSRKVTPERRASDEDRRTFRGLQIHCKLGHRTSYCLLPFLFFLLFFIVCLPYPQPLAPYFRRS